MLGTQTILLTPANWSLSRRKRGLRFDPSAQRSHAVDHGLKSDGDFGHLVHCFPELVGVDRLVQRAGADLLGSWIVGQQFDSHVAGGQRGCVDDKVIDPLFRVSLFGNGRDDDGLFWFDGHGKIWFELEGARNAVGCSSGVVNCDVASGGDYCTSVCRVRGQLTLDRSKCCVVSEASLNSG